MTLRQWVECSTLGSLVERESYEANFLHGLDLIQCAELAHVMQFDEAYWNRQFSFWQGLLRDLSTPSTAVH